VELVEARRDDETWGKGKREEKEKIGEGEKGKE
jgi:hypothetical protein